MQCESSQLDDVSESVEKDLSSGETPVPTTTSTDSIGTDEVDSFVLPEKV